MEDLVIYQTANTLGVSCLVTKSIFEFVGDSRPENVKIFFDPILQWLNDYANFIKSIPEAKAQIILVNYKLDYFNSSSAKYIIEIIKKIEKINLETNISFIQQWFYEIGDDDSKQVAEEFTKMTHAKLVLLEVENLKKSK